MSRGTFVQERAQVAAKLDAAIRSALAAAKIPEVNDRGGYVFGEFAIGTHTATREMRFFLEDVNAFTPELINRIRTEVLAGFPKWTIVPQFHSQTFTIAATTVDFGSGVVRGSVTADTPAYRRWLQESIAFDEENFGPVRRAFQFVTARVPGLLPRVPKERFVFVAAFRGDSQDAVVWLLLSPESKDATFPEVHAACNQFAVTDGGIVHPRFCRDFSTMSNQEPMAWLMAFNRPTVEAKAELAISPDEKLGTVTIPEYLTDDDLKERLAEK